MDEERLNELQRRLEALLALAPGQPKRTAVASGRGLGELLDAYQQWRYENPAKAWLMRAFTSVASVVVIVMGLWVAAGTSLGDATGLRSLRMKVTNIYYALMWASRDSGEQAQFIAPERFPGTIENVVGDVLVVTYYDAGNQHRRLVRPANVIVTNHAGFQAWAKEYLLKGVTFDFYIPLDEVKGHKVWAAVIWHKRTPVNVQLVERSLGYPEHNPPTAVVNQIFSQYYWNLAR